MKTYAEWIAAIPEASWLAPLLPTLRASPSMNDRTPQLFGAFLAHLCLLDDIGGRGLGITQEAVGLVRSKDGIGATPQ